MGNTTIGFELSLASRRWRHRLDQSLRASGMTYANWITLAYLQRGGNGMLQKALAKYMGIEAPTLVRQLDQLQRDELIVRRAVKGDRRARTVHLTPTARSVLTTFNEVAASVREELLSGISDEDIETCIRVLQGIVDNHSQYGSTQRDTSTAKQSV